MICLIIKCSLQYLHSVNIGPTTIQYVAPNYVIILLCSFFIIFRYSFLLIFAYIYIIWGRRVIGISGSVIWSKTLMELIFNPCSEFRWSPEGPVSQIHSPHRLVGAPGIFFRSFKVYSATKERVWCGKQREATAPIHP